jgi:hypothetical protein
MVDAPAVRGESKVAFQKKIRLNYYNGRHTRIIKRGWNNSTRCLLLAQARATGAVIE